MKAFRLLGQLLLVWLSLCLVQVLGGMLVPIQMPNTQPGLGWLLSGLITSATLLWVAHRAPWKGWRLALALSALPAGIQLVNVVEGAIFLTRQNIPWPRLLLFTVVAFTLAIPLWMWIFRKKVLVAAPPLSFRGLAWRLPLSSALYVFLYFLAGMIIFPFVKSFYDTQVLPSMGTILALQFFFRGPVFVGLCLLLIRAFHIEGFRGHLAVGLAFTLLSGVAPMVVPNPYFPDFARWVHLCEITGSNFLLGLLVSLLWTRGAGPGKGC